MERNAKRISDISVVAHERIGIEGRAAFFMNKPVTLRSLYQSHLLQLLAITTMAKPNQLQRLDVR